LMTDRFVTDTICVARRERKIIKKSDSAFGRTLGHSVACGPANISGDFAVARSRDRLTFRFSRLGEAEAEGRYAIAALVLAVAIRFAAPSAAAAFVLKAFLF
jgi:hypothetical protein